MKKYCIFVGNEFKRQVMIITIDKSMKNKDIEKLLQHLKPSKLFPSNRFVGKIKWNEDALSYQKRLRDEWD